MNLLTSQDQVLMDQFPMLNNINGASGLGNLDRWHWLDTPARYEDFLFFKIEFFKILCNCNLEANTPVKLRNDSHKMSTKCFIESSIKRVQTIPYLPPFFILVLYRDDDKCLATIPGMVGKYRMFDCNADLRVICERRGSSPSAWPSQPPAIFNIPKTPATLPTAAVPAALPNPQNNIGLQQSSPVGFQQTSLQFQVYTKNSA